MCVKREPMAMRRSMRACAVRARARAGRAAYTTFYGETSTRRAYPGSRPHFVPVAHIRAAATLPDGHGRDPTCGGS